MTFVVAQATEAIQEGAKFADRFGFEALFAVLLLIGAGWLSREALSHWKVTTNRLATSQELTWQQQCKISEENLLLTRENQKLFSCLTDSTAAMERTLAALSKNSNDRSDSMAVVHSHTTQLHSAIRAALLAFQQKLQESDPHIAKELSRIAEEMRATDRHGS